jgi:hypothetical protein
VNRSNGDRDIYCQDASRRHISYGEDKVIIITADGDVAQAEPKGIGRYTGPGKIAFRGAALYGANATGELSIVNNLVLIFEVAD